MQQSPIKTKAVICDLDGVVFEFQGYTSLDEFYANIEYCVPIDWTVRMLRGIYDQGINILFVTARDTKCKGITTYQLQQLFDFPIHLYMRGRWDTRPDHVVKQEHVDYLKKDYDILFAIDDNLDNCKMFQSNGIPALHRI